MSILDLFRSAWGKVKRTPSLEAARPIAYFIGGDGNLHANYGGPVSEQLTSHPDALLAGLRAAGIDPFAGEKHAAGPPPAPLNWSTWSQMQRENQREGWTFCRFAIRGRDQGAIVQVFGIVCDGFGVHSDLFYVCTPISDKRPLWALTHLRSGLGCGLFSAPDEAAQAGEVAVRLGVKIDGDNMPQDDWLRIETAWRAASLTTVGGVHAHHLVDGVSQPEPLYIWHHDIMQDVINRPLRLS